MTVLDDFRQKYPQYKDVPDGKLAAAIRTKYYAKMPIEDFYRKAGLTHLVKMDENTQPQNGLGSNVQNYFAGMGKSVSDNVRGLAQTGASMLGNALAPVDVLTKVAGIPNVVGDAARNTNQQLREDQSRANLNDAPLMATKAGLAGNISG